MNWQQVIEDQSLQDLPYKMELNEWGNIIMSPASNRHGFYQGRTAIQLEEKLGGTAITECSVQTEKGVKVPDVAWCSDEFIQGHSFETPYTVAPEICIEIISPSNYKDEIDEKIELYFQAGAIEVWTVSESGDVVYYSKAGKIENSTYGVSLEF